MNSGKKMDHNNKIDYDNNLKSDDYFLYFAYGSNMSEERLKERRIRFEMYDIGFIENMKFLMNKKSFDGSAKANIVKNNDEIVWGVLYRIASGFKLYLDSIEGNYHSQIVVVKISKSTSVKALTYMSNYITEDKRAYDDYKEIVIKGALEHNLPEYYVKFLKKLPIKPIKYFRF